MVRLHAIGASIHQMWMVIDDNGRRRDGDREGGGTEQRDDLCPLLLKGVQVKGLMRVSFYLGVIKGTLLIVL